MTAVLYRELSSWKINGYWYNVRVSEEGCANLNIFCNKNFRASRQYGMHTNPREHLKWQHTILQIHHWEVATSYGIYRFVNSHLHTLYLAFHRPPTTPQCPHSSRLALILLAKQLLQHAILSIINTLLSDSLDQCDQAGQA